MPPSASLKEALFVQRNEFETNLKHSIDIKSLYTELTNEMFQDEKSRLRARCVWRDDHTPSLAYHSGHPHILTDFTEKWDNGKPRTYDAIDLLLATQTCISKPEAVKWLCEKLGREFPMELYKGQKGLNAAHLGEAIRYVWELCKEEANRFCNTEGQSHPSMMGYFKTRDMPVDRVFLDAVNIGICPGHQKVVDYLNDLKLSETMIFSYEFEYSAIAFPLYNFAGALVGIKFRHVSKKNFATWEPTGQAAFYNFQRFSRRHKKSRIRMVEGEGNIIAYAIAAYREGGKDLAAYLDNALCGIYCTGPRMTNVEMMQGQLPSLLYYPDYDLSTVDLYTKVEDHPVFQASSHLQGQLECLDFHLVDWGQLDSVFDKFDLADYLKSVDYKAEKLRDLSEVNLYRFAVGLVNQVISHISDSDNRDTSKLQMIGNVKKRLNEYQTETIDKVSGINKEATSALKRAREAHWGPYFINDKYHVCQTEFNDDKLPIGHKTMTNFFLCMKYVITEYNVYDRERKKFYRLELFRNGEAIGTGIAEVDKITDPKKLEEFVARIGDTHTCKVAPGFKWDAIKGLMNAIEPQVSKTVLNSMGRPSFENELEQLIATDRYCLMPKVSVIGGEVVENKEIDVSLRSHAELEIEEESGFRWSVISDDQAKDAAGLFWDHLLHVHQPHIMNSLVALNYDSCTREMMGDSVIPNGHGFPIYLDGRSGSHKTTAAICAMALLGEFNTQNDLFSWDNTTNYMDNLFIKCGTITAPLDELKNELFPTMEPLVRIFNTLYGGSTRGRLSSSAVSRGDVKVKCSAIVTSEAKPRNIPESIASRMIIIRVPRSETTEAVRRKVHLDDLYSPILLNGKIKTKKCLLHGFMPRMIAWEQSQEGFPYVKTMKKWYDHYLQKVTGGENSYRTVHMVTRLVAAFDRICAFMVDSGYVSRDAARRSLEEYAAYWDTGIFEQVQQVQKHSSMTSIAKYLGELIISKKVEIATYRGDQPNERWAYHGNPNMGVTLIDVTYPDVGRKILIVAENALQQKLRQMSGNTDLVAGRFRDDGLETGLLEKVLRSPPPGSKFFSEEDEFMSIDYDVLMTEYNRTKT